MYRIICCPQCGYKICKGKQGTEIEMFCPKCKKEFKSLVDKDGGVYALPLDLKSTERLATKA